MKRNFIGTILALLLVVVIAMKQVALGFCLCTASFHVNPCECHEEASLPHSHDGGSCGCPHQESPENAPNDDPCNDCDTTISLDTGDFLWTPADDLDPEFTIIQEPSSVAFTHTFPRAVQTSLGATSPRGSPPASCALFLRVQSLRL